MSGIDKPQSHPTYGAPIVVGTQDLGAKASFPKILNDGYDFVSARPDRISAAGINKLPLSFRVGIQEVAHLVDLLRALVEAFVLLQVPQQVVRVHGNRNLLALAHAAGLSRNAIGERLFQSIQAYLQAGRSDAELLVATSIPKTERARFFTPPANDRPHSRAQRKTVNARRLNSALAWTATAAPTGRDCP